MINLQPKFNFIFVNQNFILTLFTKYYIYLLTLFTKYYIYLQKSFRALVLISASVYQWGYFYVKKNYMGNNHSRPYCKLFFKSGPLLKKYVAYDCYKRKKTCIILYELFAMNHCLICNAQFSNSVIDSVQKSFVTSDMAFKLHTYPIGKLNSQFSIQSS